MQRFAVVLFALVALFAIVVPSSASGLPQVKRETNANRFARGLPPLPPSRRATAKRQQNSPAPVSSSSSPTNRILARDNQGNSRGYLDSNSSPGFFGLSPGVDSSVLTVTYNSVDNTIQCIDAPVSAVSYLGVPNGALAIFGPAALAHGSLTTVSLTNNLVNWLVTSTGELDAVWSTISGHSGPVDFVYDTDTNILAVVVDINTFLAQYTTWVQVVLSIV